MPDDPRVQELLDELLNTDGTPEEVCGADAELLPVVRDRWRQMCHARAELDAMFPPAPEPGRTLPALAVQDTSLPAVPGYEVEAVLGRGGMGVVFRARQVRLNRPVALKMVLAGAYAGPAERECLLREAETVAALRHPNIVPVYDVGEADGRPYFTMELVEGGSLAQRLTGAPLPAGQAAALVIPVADAVEFAHRRGVVHRDLKPANVLLAADGTPKVADFSLAHRLEGPTLTRSGAAVGTPSYMAPEQAGGRSREVGPATDVYALGAILYEVLSGRPPFRGETPAETLGQVLSQEPVPPSRLNGKVPRDLETICLKCLRKEPRLRYPTAAALVGDLGCFLRGEGITARPEGPLARLARKVRRRPAFPAAVATVGLSVAVLLGGLLWLLVERAAAVRAAGAAQAATEAAANDDLAEMAGFMKQSAWPEARAALERARGRAGARSSADLRVRLDRAGADLDLVARLDAIRLTAHARAGWVLDFAGADRAYEGAFSGGGFGRVHDDPGVVAARVASSGIRTALVAALDHWSACAPERDRRAWVITVADLAADDPAGWRARARDPAVWKDQAALERAIETTPFTAQSVPLLLALEMNSGADGGVRTLFLKRVHRAYPGDFWVNHRLGDVLVHRGERAEAVGHYRAALAARPGAITVHNNLATTLEALGRVDEAVEQYRHALRLDPSAVPVYCNLSIVLSSRRRYDENIEQLRVGIRFNPGAAKLHAALGGSLAGKGLQDEAVASFRRAVAIDPNDPDAHQGLRKVFTSQGRLEEASDEWRRALDAKPPEHEGWDGYAELCLFLGRRDEYHRACGELLDRFNTSPDLQVSERTGRACLLAPSGPDEVRRAAGVVDRIMVGDWKRVPAWVHPYLWFAKGVADYRQGRPDSAVSIMRGKAAGVLGPAPGLVTAMAEYRLGRKEEARKALAAAIRSFDWEPRKADTREAWMYHVLRREAERVITTE